MKKLNTMRVLERAKVPYEVLTFPESVHSAEGVAAHFNLPAHTILKTLVVERPTAGSKPLLVMVSGDKELDLRALAASLGEKRLRMARHIDAERLTGLQVGGISSLALLNRGFQICVDRSATESEQIVISAGRRGVNLKLRARDLLRVTNATPVDVG